MSVVVRSPDRQVEMISLRVLQQPEENFQREMRKLRGDGEAQSYHTALSRSSGAEGIGRDLNGGAVVPLTPASRGTVWWAQWTVFPRGDDTRSGAQWTDGLQFVSNWGCRCYWNPSTKRWISSQSSSSCVSTWLGPGDPGAPAVLNKQLRSSALPQPG